MKRLVMVAGHKSYGESWVRLVAAVFGSAILLAFPRASRADPGNLISWFSNSMSELTFTCQTAVVTLEMLDVGVARVRLTTNNAPFSTSPSYTITRNWPRPPMGVSDGTPLVVTNAGLRIEVSKTPFRLTFEKPDSTVLLSEVNSYGLDYRGTTNYANFSMPSDEQFYGLGMVFFKPLSYRGQTRTLYNARVSEYGGQGATTDMAVPLMISSKGYALFMDNTFSQYWDFTTDAGPSNWLVRTDGGELNYYFFAGDAPAQLLDLYTQATGRAPVPPRWALGYIQSKNAYTNWAYAFSVKDALRTNDLPCDALVLDGPWSGPGTEIGGVTWDTNNFPNPAANIATLGAAGFKVMVAGAIYINSQNEPAKTNFDEAAGLKYLMATNYPARDVPRIPSSIFGAAGYIDFNNPATHAWWFGKLQHLVDEGVAAHFTDFAEPEYDNSTDYSYDGRQERQLHNVMALLWHECLAEGYATNYPNQRLYMLSRSGFAGDQRFGAAHWSNDTAADWPTLTAHENALCNYSLSGLSYFGSDIGGYWPAAGTNNELYTRWFEFGAFCPVFRAHGINKPVAPYEYADYVEEICRVHSKLHYRLLPYIYTAARETFDSGLPMCRPMLLAFPAETNVLNNGTQYMFGPNIMVAPITTSNLTSRPVYLPAGNWIDQWNGQVLAGPVTTNWPGPLSQIPLFYRDNTITPLGPYVETSQFDDGSQRAVRIYCRSSAGYTLYDDDGASNGYRSNEFATTSIKASRSGNIVSIQIGGASGSYSNQPGQRAWGIELYCTNAVFNVVADGSVLANLPNAAALAAATSGFYLDSAEKLLRIKLPSAAITQAHSVSAYFDLQAPGPHETRIKAVNRPYLDSTGVMWAQDQAYSAGSFGYSGGTMYHSTNAIAGTDDTVLFQSERYGSPFSYLFDAPNGKYEIKLLDAETYWNNPDDRLINVFINGQQVLTNFDILVAAGGKNTALTLTFTNTVASGQMAIVFSATPGHPEVNARVSAIDVRKIADPDSVGDGIPDWWRATNFGGTGTTTNSSSCAACDPDGDGLTNLQEFQARSDPNSALAATISGNLTAGYTVTWPSVAGKIYRIYSSNDLQTWTPVVPDIPAASSLTQWTDPGPLPQNKFCKVPALP